MKSLFEYLALVDVDQDVVRNIVSQQYRQDPFDDLTSDPTEQLLAQQILDHIDSPMSSLQSRIVDHPFGDNRRYNTIHWPFRNWQASRFSDGTFGVWYGSKTIETTVHETAFHWYHSLLGDAGFEQQPVIAEREVYWVTCSTALLDFRKVVQEFPDLLHPSDYTFCQLIGKKIHREGHPGLLVPSVRHPAGENFAIFSPNVLHTPQLAYSLTYCLAGEQIVVAKSDSPAWLTIEVRQLQGKTLPEPSSK